MFNNLNPYMLLAFLVLLGGSFSYGWVKGSAFEYEKFEKDRLALQQDAFDLADEINLKNAEILVLQQKQKELAHELEQEALSAEGANTPGIAATGGLRRLEKRWSSN